MAAPLQAKAPNSSLIPEARPWQSQVAATRSNVAALPNAAVFLFSAPGVKSSLRPVPRPKITAVATEPVQPTQKTKQALWIGGRGKLCGSTKIIGQPVDPVRGRLAGCGILNPVKITAVEGVQLSRAATVDCPTALALADWVKNGLKPAIGNRGGGIAVIDVIGSYSCRTRNSKPGAKISEHGRGRAIDISGFRLADGTRLDVLSDWRKGRNGQTLRKVHALACGPFGTVLGPNADVYHQDHFHFDTANHRSGSYCR